MNTCTTTNTSQVVKRCTTRCLPDATCRKTGHTFNLHSLCLTENDYDMLWAGGVVSDNFHCTYYPQATPQGMVSRGSTWLKGNLYVKYAEETHKLLFAGAAALFFSIAQAKCFLQALLPPRTFSAAQPPG